MKLYLPKLCWSLWKMLSALSPKKTQTYTFFGNEMTLDYHITIGSALSPAEKRQIQDIIYMTFREVDNCYNNWNPDSEVSKLNRLKANQVIPLSPELENFLFLTNDIVKLTKGKFDPTIEPLQQLWKSHLKEGILPLSAEIQAMLPVIGWHNLHFGHGEFFKDFDLTSLDFGGIAKGYCVDLLVERIVQAGFHDVFVEWEGEIRANGIHPDKRPWKVLTTRLEDTNPEHAILHISLENQSVATSGDYMQNWKIEKDGIETVFFHIIDPETGRPLVSTQSSVANATVVAPTCILADALASVAMMHPSPAEATAWLTEINKQHPEIQCWVFSRQQLERL